MVAFCCIGFCVCYIASSFVGQFVHRCHSILVNSIRLNLMASIVSTIDTWLQSVNQSTNESISYCPPPKFNITPEKLPSHLGKYSFNHDFSEATAMLNFGCVLSQSTNQAASNHYTLRYLAILLMLQKSGTNHLRFG